MSQEISLSYTYCLQKLAEIPDDIEFSELDVKYRKYGDWLCRGIGKIPDPGDIKTPDKCTMYKYNFMKFVSRGREGIVCLAWDPVCKRQVIIKFAMPVHIERKKNAARLGQKKNIWAQMGGFFSHVALKGAQKRETEPTLRFFKGCEIQQLLYQVMTKRGFRDAYIPAVYDIGRSPKLYIVMEPIEGEELLYWAKKAEKRDIVKIFLAIIRLFEEIVHYSSVIHGDIKPNNFLVTGGKVPVLLDFTMAKKIDRKLTTNAILGNELYSSPGQLKCSKDRTYTDDVFSLLLTLWSMWNGDDPSGRFYRNQRNFKELFPSAIFPHSLQKVFERGVYGNNRYDDISDLRSDISGIFEETAPSPCNELARLEALERRVADINRRIKNAGESLRKR